MTEYISSSPEQTADIGKEVAKCLDKGSAILFRGEMGAGKTHFTKGVAEFFGSSADEVTSPTFALVNEYEGETSVFHFDLFRIDTLDDLYAIGFFDYLDRNGIMAIEWSENIPELTEILPDFCVVEITKLSDTERKIVFTPKEEARCLS